MKKNWLLIVLIFSLAVNLAAVGTIGYHWWRESRPRVKRPFWGRGWERGPLKLTDSQIARMEDMWGTFRADLSGLRDQLHQKRGELIDLLRNAESDSLTIDRKLDEIAALQAKLEKRAIRKTVKMRNILTPQQREEFFTLFKDRFRHGRMMPHRRGRGPGRMGRGYPPPKEYNSPW
ncbi:periplasmic heavy metal sensor [candidate division KSB1 bacterium]|nr:periplasmic heavy metal sensor [candidate division KSB1 bacterium]